MSFLLNFSRRQRATTRTIALAALCANLTGTLNLSAAPAAAVNTAVPGRYLLIVETSDGMRRRTAGTQKLIGDLLRSGFNGQLQPGDTLGVWTFNDKLHTGVFPLQLWTPQTREKIAASVVAFLQAQRYEKPGALGPVLPEMAGVVKDSDKITVLLITTGADKIRGTPFDAEINDTYALNQSVQEKARLPYVTILRAVKGEFSGFTVNTPPWPVEFPKFSPPPPTPKPVVTPALNDADKEQQRRAALRQTLEGGKIISATGTISMTPLNDGTVTAATPTTQPAPPPPTTAAPAPAPVASTPPNPAPETPALSPDTKIAAPAPIPVAAEPPPAVFKVVPETNATPPPQPKPVAPVIASPPPQPKPVAPVVAPPVPAEPASMPAPGTEEPPPAKALPRSVILIAGAALVLVALALLVVLLRRPTRRPPERISLITRSLDKEKK